MSEAGCKIVNWNVAWRRAGAKFGNEIRARIDAEAADVVCLTEAHEDFFGDAAHMICSQADYGYPLGNGRRKALLWSRNPWTDIDEIGSAAMPSGRFVKGRTQTPVGPLTFIGVCIPWAATHVSTGRRDRRRWEDHLAYLDGLKKILPQFTGETVVLGDFNQTIPRKHALKSAYDSLLDAFNTSFKIATTGEVCGIGVQVIDHLAHSQDLAASRVRGLPKLGEDKKELTDHFGVSATIRRCDRV